MGKTPLPNADHLSELNETDKKALIDYITNNLKMVSSVNTKQSAYGLKARFNRLTDAQKEHHITSQCFMEAMVECGYTAVPIKNSAGIATNWRFNVAKTHFTD